MLRHPTQPLVYATSSDEGGSVVTLSVADGAPRLVNQIGGVGANPCHLAWAPDGTLWCATYDAGHATRLSMSSTGLPVDPRPLPVPSGEGPARAHHCLPYGENVLVSYLARDVLGVHDTSGALLRSIALPAGSGPRSLVLGEGGVLWVSCEVAATVLRAEEAAGLWAVRSVRSCDGDPADAHPSVIVEAAPYPTPGCVVIGNRGRDTLGVVMADPGLRLVGEAPCGRWPEDVVLHERELIVACRDANQVEVWDVEDLCASPSHARPKERIGVPAPVALVVI